MPMRFEQFAQDVHTELNDSTVELVLGEQQRGTNRQRRRVHWYMTGGELTSPRQAGGRTDSGTTSRAPAVIERQETIVCRVFAESTDTLDALFDNLIVAISKAWANNSAMLADSASYTFDHDQVAKRVPVIVLEFPIKLPVLDEVKQLVTITAEELTCEIDDD